MKCLDQYRRKLLMGVNRNLQIIAETPDEESIHQFRVGAKRLTALYRFLDAVEPELRVRRRLKPMRRLSRSLGNIRDRHITQGLIRELNCLDSDTAGALQQALLAQIESCHREFHELALDKVTSPLRLPTLRSLQFTQGKILRLKPRILRQLLQDLSSDGEDATVDSWHDKRKLLKRYRHTLEAFSLCPGQQLDTKELKLIGLLEQLLGDWHDRVIAIGILEALEGLESKIKPAINELRRQQDLLLDTSRLYLLRFIERQVSPG